MPLHAPHLPEATEYYSLDYRQQAKIQKAYKFSVVNVGDANEMYICGECSALVYYPWHMKEHFDWHRQLGNLLHFHGGDLKCRASS
jgi:hypothetical protein